jgi:hypothetical protein
MVEKIYSKMTVTTKMPSSWAKAINRHAQDISSFSFKGIYPVMKINILSTIIRRKVIRIIVLLIRIELG